MNEKIARKLKQLSDTPGVYKFFNSSGELIYVGKASSLKNRVRGYFKEMDPRLREDDKRRPIEEMIHEVINFKVEETDSALEAAILEGKYIKEYRPKYNVDWRDDKSWNYIAITKDKFPKVTTVREHELSAEKKKEFKYLFGPYPGLNTKEAIKILRRIFLFSECEPSGQRSFVGTQDDERLDSLRQPADYGNDKVKPCFYYQLGQCLGVCTGEISSADYLKKVINPLKMFLSGKKKILMKQIEKLMHAASKTQNFEEATRLRNQLAQLQKIQDIALLNSSFIKDPTGIELRVVSRIEGYDISNLGESDKVGSMVVFNAVGPVKNQYRKFKIKTVSGQSDVDCLIEVLNRRLKHNEWKMPDIFLVDGGLPQVNAAKKVLRAHQIVAPIVGIAKGAKRKRNDFFVVGNMGSVLKNWIEKNKNILIAVRDEAHRFAIKFNREQRKI